MTFSDELRSYYDLYQLLLFHFFDLIEEQLNTVNPTFQRFFRTFLSYRKYIINAMRLPYSNAKLEATNKLIKNIKRQAFGLRNFEKIKQRF